jgi:hypothetical protein
MASAPMMTVGTSIAEFLLPLATIFLQDFVTLVAKQSASQGKSAKSLDRVVIHRNNITESHIDQGGGMKRKLEIITFKVDEGLLKAIKGIPNRSEFIRGAVIAALGVVCPLCNGSGMLSSNQKTHWEEFAEDHSIERCDDCDERFLVCSRT